MIWEIKPLYLMIYVIWNFLEQGNWLFWVKAIKIHPLFDDCRQKCGDFRGLVLELRQNV